MKTLTLFGIICAATSALARRHVFYESELQNETNPAEVADPQPRHARDFHKRLEVDNWQVHQYYVNSNDYIHNTGMGIISHPGNGLTDIYTVATFEVPPAANGRQCRVVMDLLTADIVSPVGSRFVVQRIQGPYPTTDDFNFDMPSHEFDSELLPVVAVDGGRSLQSDLFPCDPYSGTIMGLELKPDLSLGTPVHIQWNNDNLSGPIIVIV